MKQKVTTAVLVVSLLTYLASLAPGLTGEDSGELVAAAYTLGNCHPPGYPLWCLTTWPLVHLPWKDPAYGANLASALASSAAVALTAELLLTLGARPLAAAAAGLLVAFSSTLWCQSVIAEVYAINLLVLVGLVRCLVGWRARPDRAHWRLGAAFLTGLALTAHPSVLLLYPLIFVCVLGIGRGRLSFSFWLTSFLAVLAGLCLFLYLPIRAAADPAMNWGDPDTPERFWAHVTRAQYPTLANQRTPAMAVAQVQALGGMLIRQWPAPLALVVAVGGLWGLVRTVREDRWLALSLAAGGLLMSVGYAWLLNFELDWENVHIAEVFFIPAWWCLVVLFGLALTPRSAAFGLGLALLAGAGNFSRCSMAGNTVAERYGRDLLATLPPQAVVFTSADYEVFPLNYLQIVKGLRPDVAVLDEERDRERLPQMKGRAIFSTRLPGFLPAASQPVGLLYMNGVSPQEAAALDKAAWEKYAPAGPEGPWREDWSTASLLGLYDQARARSALAYGGDPQPHLQRAAQRQPHDALLHNSLGAMLSRAGQPEAALDYYLKAAEIQPTYRSAYANILLTYLSLARWDEARQLLEQCKQKHRLPDNARAVEELLLQARILEPDWQAAQEQVNAHPEQAQGWFDLADLKMRLHVAGARLDLEKAVQLKPDFFEAWVKLGLQRAQEGDREGMAAAFQQALKLKPEGPEAEALRDSLR